ncbi:hypothetical protein D3C71_1692460 [compost metagenome]
MSGEHHRQRAEQRGVDAEEQRQRQFRRTAQDHPRQAHQQHQRRGTTGQHCVMARGACLQPQGFVEQDHFKQFAIHREERQDRKAETPTAAHQAALDVILPGRGMATVVHPHAEPQHHDAGEQRCRTFQQFTL